MKNETLRVLRIKAQEAPEEAAISAGLESLQHEVDGYIECVYPYDDDVALIVNEEGKIKGMDLNRALRDEEGEIYDIIAGTFLVVGLTEDDFTDLTDEQVKKYTELFRYPEIFLSIEHKIYAFPVTD